MQSNLTLSVTKDSQYYVLKGETRMGSFLTKRHHNHFQLLHFKVAEMAIGMYLPTLPPPLSPPGQIDSYLTALSRYSYICFSQLFQEFLTGVDFTINQIVCLEECRGWSRQSGDYGQMLLFYQQDLGKSLSPDSTLRQEEVSLDAIERDIKTLYDFKFQVTRIISIRDQYTRKLNQCLTKSLPLYEHLSRHRIISTISEGLPLLSPRHICGKYLELAHKWSGELTSLLESIKGRKWAEGRARRLREQIQESRKELSRVSDGKFTFKSLLRKGDTSEQIASLSDEIIKMEGNFSALSKIIQILQVHCVEVLEEIQTRRRQEYLRVIKEVAQLEIAGADQASRLFNTIRLHASADIVSIQTVTQKQQINHQEPTMPLPRQEELN